MKRYMAFANAMYYASGGMEDFVDSFDDLEAAKDKAIEHATLQSNYSWWHVYDCALKSIVAEDVIDL